ncbi:hypothetical protein BH11PSE7_BH11PSE7_35010 [soil metagenome]
MFPVDSDLDPDVHPDVHPDVGPDPLTGARVVSPAGPGAGSTLAQAPQAARADHFLDAFPAHVAWLDPDGKIVRANRRWREFALANAMQGIAAGVGDNYLDICLSTQGLEREQALDAAAGIQSVIHGEAPEYSLEYPCHSPQQQRWFQMVACPLDTGQGALVMHLDITPTRLKQLATQARLEQSQTSLLMERDEVARLNGVLEERVALRTQQLQAANHELEAFSYSIAHDLRSPLSSIHGFGKLLERAMPADASERARHYLSRIGNGAVRMGEMIDALLALAQLSRVGLHRDDVSLYSLAGAVFAGLQESEPERRVALELGEGPSVSGDSRLLKMVMENLLGNAWKFSARQAGATITFAQECGADGQTHYFVRDNGIGFDMAHAGKLFGAFERMFGSSDYAGHGIGLANVKRIINRHGGRVWAESVPGQGATFYFTLGEPPSPPGP